MRYTQGDLPPVEIGYVGIRLRDPDGRLLGTALLYAPDLPASILLLVTRGDQDMFARMARLVEPDDDARRSCSLTSSPRPTCPAGCPAPPTSG